MYFNFLEIVNISVQTQCKSIGVATETVTSNILHNNCKWSHCKRNHREQLYLTNSTYQVSTMIIINESLYVFVFKNRVKYVFGPSSLSKILN